MCCSIDDDDCDDDDTDNDDSNDDYCNSYNYWATMTNLSLDESEFLARQI